MKPQSQKPTSEASKMDDLKTRLLQTPQDATLKEVKFRIQGITCASCVNSIESVVGSLDGVQCVMVSAIDGKATIKYVPEFISANKIKQTVEEAGFEVHDLSEQDISVCKVRIKGMACTSCSESVERALQMVDGVKKAAVGLALGEAKVHFDPNITNVNKIIEAIEDAGFGVELISSGSDLNKLHLRLEGLDSPEDVDVVMSSLKSSEGVNHVEMDLTDRKVTVTYDPDVTGPRSIIQCIQAAAYVPNEYHATLYSPPRQRETESMQEVHMYRDQFLFSCLFSVPVFLFSMVLPMLPPYGNWLNYKIHNMLTIGMFLRWILCTPVQFIVGKRFYVGSYHALR